MPIDPATATLFDPICWADIERRVAALRPDQPRQWGKMTLAQALWHLAAGIDAATGARPIPQKFLGKLLGPFFRGALLGPKPFSKNSPTAPEFVTEEACAFESERARLLAAIRTFVEQGPESAARHPHGFLGRLSGAEWGRIQWKHLDHHLRQFGG